MIVIPKRIKQQFLLTARVWRMPVRSNLGVRCLVFAPTQTAIDPARAPFLMNSSGEAMFRGLLPNPSGRCDAIHPACCSSLTGVGPLLPVPEVQAFIVNGSCSTAFEISVFCPRSARFSVIEQGVFAIRSSKRGTMLSAQPPGRGHSLL